MSTLYLLRHADAQVQQSGQTDAERALTARGRAQCQAVSQFMRDHHIAPANVWASPYVRTQQTAKMICESFKHSHVLHSASWLALGESTTRAMDEIAKLSDKHHELFLISHEPNLSELIIAFLGANPKAVHIKKASLTALALDSTMGQRATLIFSLPPALMSVGK